MNRRQYLSLTTQDHAVCTICLVGGKRYAPTLSNRLHVFHHESMLIAGTRATGRRDGLELTTIGSPLYMRRAYRNLESHLRTEHRNHLLVLKVMGWEPESKAWGAGVLGSNLAEWLGNPSTAHAITPKERKRQ